ncbi:ArnT family glycosyltransferase [Streptomyces sp. 351MFTsu5.1]|uniref:ArnT family glycosyltransferase n=1 Tax=Streptomyces sp. 351MFTsu5.1 TaxID=1172180 RepID=UPI0006853B44|nr:phospholipid carrier-dependent glycosyltransferase [Streptomyces sp. 351MFTsu5.1]
MMTSEQQAVLEPVRGSGSRDDERRRPRAARRWLVSLLVVVLLAQMAAVMVTTAVQQTPTIDEPVYVATAAEYLHGQGIRYNPEHPPLGKLVIAVGVAIADPHVDTAFHGPQIDLGPHLLYESGNDPWTLMFWGRLPVIVLTLLFGLVVFTFARELAGRAAGLTALALYAFSPDVVAHGSLATLDVPTAGFLLTSVWLLWRARLRPRLYVPLAGLALGAALATKMSALPAVPVFMGLAALSVWHAHPDTERRRRLFQVLSGAAVTAVAAIAVVWASYLVVDPRLRWTSQDPVPVVHGLRGTLAHLLPLPRPYTDGMLLQFRFENHPWEGFLFGRVYTGHLWYYLPAALLVKTPLGLLALWAAGAVVLVTVRRLRPAAPYLLVPAGVLLASAMTGVRDFGTRYTLFLPMFLTVAAGCVLAVRRRWATGATAALVLFVAVSSLRTFPYYLPYSNEAFGGPSATHLRLHDSNVDWGQDLGRLADRLRERYPHERIWLVYKGSGVPSAYGIEASDPREVPAGEVRGLLVVSDSSVAKAKGRLAELIDSSRPVDEVGHSITIYRR